MVGAAKIGQGNGFSDSVFAEEGSERGVCADFNVIDGNNDVAFFQAGFFGGRAGDDGRNIGAVSRGKVVFYRGCGVEASIADSDICALCFPSFEKGF